MQAWVGLRLGKQDSAFQRIGLRGNQVEVSQARGQAHADAAKQGDAVGSQLPHALQQGLQLGAGFVQQLVGELIPVAGGVEHPGGEAAIVGGNGAGSPAHHLRLIPLEVIEQAHGEQAGGQDAVVAEQGLLDGAQPQPGAAAEIRDGEAAP